MVLHPRGNDFISRIDNFYRVPENLSRLKWVFGITTLLFLNGRYCHPGELEQMGGIVK